MPRKRLTFFPKPRKLTGQRRLLKATLALQSAWLRAAAGTPGRAPAARTARADTPTFRTGHFQFGPDRYRYRLFVPEPVTDRPRPVIVMLHGCEQDAADFARGTDMNALARRRGAIVVYPEQLRKVNRMGCWNWFAPAAQTGRGELDVALHALHATSQRMACNRFAAVGLSAGGGLAALLAFHHADQFDAVVAVAAPPVMGVATLQDPRRVMREGLVQAPERAVWGLRRVAPLLVLHGRDDTVVHPCCAQQLAEQA